MKTSSSARAAALAFLLAGAALPALGQDRPESILPPGFGDPQPAPTPTPTPVQTGTGPAPVLVQPLPPRDAADVGPAPAPSATPSAAPTVDPAVLAEYEMPAFARRSLDIVGPAGPGEGALGPGAWGRSDGRFLETLMRRLDAPGPSRWAHILLRRALVARADTPAGVNGADFAAERAWLLIRMGEAQAARAVVQSVDNDDYTPKLYQVAMNAMLAANDPAGLCPLAEGAAAATREPGWTLARGMCAALAGDANRGTALLRDARRRGLARGVDLLLAEKVVGAAGGRRAITIEWDGVDHLSTWRWGLATTTGVEAPADLMAGVGPQVRLWAATSPMTAAAARLEAAEAGAQAGVLSSAALADLYARTDEDDDLPAAAGAVADDLRSAFTGRDLDARAAAMRAVWGEGRPPYARLLLTARAAARLPVREGLADADLIVASMLGAGMDRTAARWRDAVRGGSDAAAMIALSDPDARGRLSYGELASYSGTGDAAAKQRLFFAGLAGLGRLAPNDVERGAEALDVPIGRENSWVRALDRAAAAGEQGTVALLAAVGMQTGSWNGVRPEMLYRIVGALRAVGLQGEARMIAAEAIARG